MNILITGVTGQDGYWLAKAAGEQGMNVFGLVHGQRNPKEHELRHELPFVNVLQGDLTDYHSLRYAIEISKPDIVINLGAITYIPMSWHQPEVTFKVNTLGVLNLLNAVQAVSPKATVIQASTSEMFGNIGGFINEESKMSPVSPYGTAKLAAHNLCLNYREAYGLNVISAIMFNHESERRGPEFVTRKITLGAARIKKALDNDTGVSPEPVRLGNLEAVRDWGYSPNYMDGLLKVAKEGKLGSYVLATGVPADVASFARVSFESLGLDWRDWVVSDAVNLRPNELGWLRGDARQIYLDTGWTPNLDWKAIAKLMTQADYQS